MRAVAFSDSSTIAYINQNYIPYELNLTKEGFPEALTGLARWQRLYESQSKYSMAFATSIVLTSSGQAPLATSGWGHRWEIDTATNYDSKLYLNYLQNSLARFQRLQTLIKNDDKAGLERIRQEITDSIRQANQSSAR